MRTEEHAIVKMNDLEIDQYRWKPLPSLRDLVAVPFRQRWPMFIVFACVVIAIAISGAWSPKYDAQMKILALHQRSVAVVTSSANAPTEFSSDQVSEEDLNSEVELLNSDDVLRKVVVATGLARRSASSTDAGGAGSVEIAARQLSNALKIAPVKKTNVISVRYQAHDPELAAKVLRELATAYMEKHLEVHRTSGEFNFFDQQTEQYKQGLNQAQEELTDFTKATGVVSAQVERDAALKQADSFESTAHQAQTALLETEQRTHALQAELQFIKPRMTTIVRSSDNPGLLEQLKSTLLDLQLKRAELLTKYEPSYRLVQEVDQKIAETMSAVSAEESRPIRDESSDQNPDYRWVQAELTKSQADLIGLKARASAAATVAKRYQETAQRLSQSEIAQQNLLRAAKTQEANYLLYVQRREEARISDALDKRGILNVSLVEQPVVPAAPKRSKLGVALLTLLLAGVFGLSTAFVLDFLDPTFRTPDELASYLGTPVLASLPKGRE